MNTQFVWSGELGEQARYRQIRPTKAVADKVGTAVCKLLFKPVEFFFELWGRYALTFAKFSQGVSNEMAGRPPIGDRAMTNAERQARWRHRHEAKLARKARRRGGHPPPTEESLAAMIPTWEDWQKVMVP